MADDVTLPITIEADATPAAQAFQQVEAKIRNLERGMKSTAKAAKEATDASVKGFGEFGDSVDSATEKLAMMKAGALAVVAALAKIATMAMEADRALAKSAGEYARNEQGAHVGVSGRFSRETRDALLGARSPLDQAGRLGVLTAVDDNAPGLSDAAKRDLAKRLVQQGGMIFAGDAGATQQYSAFVAKAVQGGMPIQDAMDLGVAGIDRLGSGGADAMTRMGDMLGGDMRSAGGLLAAGKAAGVEFGTMESLAGRVAAERINPSTRSMKLPGGGTVKSMMFPELMGHKTTADAMQAVLRDPALMERLGGPRGMKAVGVSRGLDDAMAAFSAAGTKDLAHNAIAGMSPEALAETRRLAAENDVEASRIRRSRGAIERAALEAEAALGNESLPGPVRWAANQVNYPRGVAQQFSEQNMETNVPLGNQSAPQSYHPPIPVKVDVYVHSQEGMDIRAQELRE